MIEFRLRPWGRTEWLLKKSGIGKWHLLGCLATEKRSVDSAAYLGRFSVATTLVKIRDSRPAPDGKDDAYYSENLKAFEDKFTGDYNLFDEHIKAPIDRIEEIVAEVSKLSGNVLLDITSFPKRWFYPIIRYLVENDAVRNLFVVYTRGTGYPKVISENPEPLRAIPSFVSLEERTKHDYAFVGVGFQTSGMRSLFGEDSARSLQLLFPFPPGPPGFQRNWRFAQQIQRVIHEDEAADSTSPPVRYLRLEAVDTSQAFDAIRITTQNGARTSVLAPYGPKPFSLAMCLYSLAAERAGFAEVPVFYSQPQRYLPDYTLGTSFCVGDVPDAWCYAVKFEGRNFYELEASIS